MKREDRAVILAGVVAAAAGAAAAVGLLVDDPSSVGTLVCLVGCAALVLLGLVGLVAPKALAPVQKALGGQGGRFERWTRDFTRRFDERQPH